MRDAIFFILDVRELYHLYSILFFYNVNNFSVAPNSSQKELIFF